MTGAEHIPELDAQTIMIRLSDVYFVGVIWILGIGFFTTAWVTWIFVTNFKKLNSVVKSYMR
jgi:hypothetical protein